MSKRYISAVAAAAAFGLALSMAPVVQATPSGSLDGNSIVQLCNSPSLPSGSSLAPLCAPINGASAEPAVASGNNIDITGEQGEGVNSVQDRLERLRKGEDEENGGQAMDWTIGKLGIYASVNGQWSDRDSTALQIGNEASVYGVAIGADYRFSDNFVAGLNFAYGNSDIDFVGNSGNLDVDDFSFTAYGSWTPNESLYLDFYGGYGFQDYDSRRNINFILGGAPIALSTGADFDGDEFRVGGNMGYEVYRGAWSYGPYASLAASFKDIDSYSEVGTTGFEVDMASQDITSFQSTVGGHVAYAISTDFGVVVPDARIEWVHEFSDDSRAIASNFTATPANVFSITTDSADRNFGRVGASVSAIWPGGWIAFADYEYQFAHSFLSYHQVTLGVRLEF